MCSHYLIEPVACTPASGWEKGQVENQVGLVRERFFSPRLRVKSYDELNAWLLDQCIAYARAHRHPELRDQTVWSVFEAERPSLVPYVGRFDGFPRCHGVGVQDLPRAVRQQPLLGLGARGRPSGGGPRLCRADRVAPGRQDRRRTTAAISAVTRPCLTPGTTSRCWARKPGALRNGAPFKDWLLPSAMERIRRKLAGSADGDRQMVRILATVLSDGLTAVEAACAEALREATHSADVVINILARHREPAPPMTILTPDALRLTHAPVADCARYDSLRRPI